MKIAIIGAGKWGQVFMVRIFGKAKNTTLPLWQLQQLAHMTSHITREMI